jgi:hypothetical protein
MSAQQPENKDDSISLMSVSGFLLLIKVVYDIKINPNLGFGTGIESEALLALIGFGLIILDIYRNRR